LYKQVLDPVSNSLGWSSLFAMLPVLVLFVLLGGLRVKAHWASLVALAVAIFVAIVVYPMPAGQAFDSAAEGATFGLFPIMWIVINALWIYNMTVHSGHFASLRSAFGAISSDQRIQAIVVAFCFGSLLEALAGFGTPVAICAAMMIGLGFKPVKAAALALVADTAPVAFGAIAIPITTLSQVTGLPQDDLGAMVGRQTPFIALVLPFVLVFMVDGMRGLRQTWQPALVAGATFAVAQFVTSNYISVPITDIIAALLSAGALFAFLQVWRPKEELGTRPLPAVAGGSVDDPDAKPETKLVPEPAAPGDRPERSRLIAFAPYAIIVVILGLSNIDPFKGWLNDLTHKFDWPGLHVTNAKGKPLMSLTFTFNWAAAAGTLLLVSGLLTVAVLRIRVADALRVYGETLAQIKWAILTVMAVLAMAYVMNQSGQTITLGTWAAGAGSAFAFLSGIIGWLGVSVTGSDTSSNALFGLVQTSAAGKTGISPILLSAANSSGGVMGKMISPQNLAIGTAAVGMTGREGDLFRRVLGWSLALLLVLCLLVLLQNSAALSWMVVGK
jgi:lactate permease